MAVQIRSKRKKNFRSSEAMQFDDPATPTLSREVEKPDDESSLNVRRSSRKPKPKKLTDDFEEDIPLDIKIKQEPLDEDELTPTVYMSEAPVFDTEHVDGTTSFVINPGARLRRETRKSFQNYLETLGYNRDFSKISEQEQDSEPQQRSGKSSGKRVSQVNLKTESEDNFTQSWPLPNETYSLSEQTDASSKVRSSSRTPRPKKIFSLLEEEINMSASRSGLDSVDPTDVHLDIQKQATKKDKSRKYTSGSEKVRISVRCRSTPTSNTQPTSTPLGKNEVDEPNVMSDEMDGTPTRTSGRVRVPKRQFSLLEDEAQSDAKREKLMSPEHIASSEVKKGKRTDSIIPSEDQVTAQSSVVVKRSNGKKGKKKKEQKGNTLDSCPGKVMKIIEDINIKREVDTTESSQSETEKKTVVKKGRERIENIVKSLLLAKQSDLVSTQEEIPEEQTSSQKKGVKRKRESTGNEGTKKNGKGMETKKVKKNPENEHIVLKLHISHGKDKDKTKDEKHHHKHHHHKHKKTKEGEPVVNKQKKKSTATIKTTKKVPAKKTMKKKKLNIKQEPDDDTHPHVKLIIKKSPTKSATIAEVMMQDMSEQSSELPEGSSQDSKETVVKKPEIKKKSSIKKKPDMKKKPDAKKKSVTKKKDIKRKPPNKKYKPLTVKPSVPRPFRKKKDKTMKARTVSAYSLFTKNRRRGLLEKEPDLDFATTSRRLAAMWKSLPPADQEYWKAKARAVRMPNGRDPTRSFLRGRRGRYDSYNWSHFSDVPPSSTGTEAIDMAAYLKLLGESLCSIGMCLKRQDQMEVHGSLSVLLDTALCSIVPIFCLTSQLPVMAGCSHETQAQILDNLAYIIPGL